ncbi:type VI secretion protein [Burkholderia sp. Bp9012]|nr:type VI secretion protein [Burkholderia sp. Bp9012]
MGDLTSYAYYVLVYQYLQDEIAKFQSTVLGNLMQWVSGLALVLVTIWIMLQGYRIVTGQSREPMMELVVRSARVVLIVTAATTMSIMNADLQSYLSANGGLASEVSQLVAGNDSPVSQIDQNMAAVQLTMAAIDTVQVSPGNTDESNEKGRAMMLATFGTASPPMAAGAMLLLYQFVMAMFVGFGPLFILCLMFEQTKSFFQRWLFYGIATMFSMAMLDVISSIVLKLTLNIAGALWASSFINHITGDQAEGFGNMALQQGGIGLLMTVLIVSVPPAAAAFFGGAVGNFYSFSQFQSKQNHPGPQGQAPGTYASGSNSTLPSALSGHQTSERHGNSGGSAYGSVSPGSDPRLTGAYAAGANGGAGSAQPPGTYGLAGKQDGA